MRFCTVYGSLGHKKTLTFPSGFQFILRELLLQSQFVNCCSVIVSDTNEVHCLLYTSDAADD